MSKCKCGHGTEDHSSYPPYDCNCGCTSFQPADPQPASDLVEKVIDIPKIEDATEDYQLGYHFGYTDGFRAASQQNADLIRERDEARRILTDALSVRKSNWIIRFEEHSGSGPGYYAMHDFWEGGQIGPYPSVIKAYSEMLAALEEKE